MTPDRGVTKIVTKMFAIDARKERYENSDENVCAHTKFTAAKPGRVPKAPCHGLVVAEGDGQAVKLLRSGQRDCLTNSFGKLFACSRECPGDKEQGMSHGFVAI